MLQVFVLIALVFTTKAEPDLCDRFQQTTNCAGWSTQGDCELYHQFNQSTLSNSMFKRCEWISGTCQATDQCKPSCFIGNNKKSTTTNCFIGSSQCDGMNFIGGYGDSQLCVSTLADGGSQCNQIYCDYKCTGYKRVSSCTGYSQYVCPTVHYEDTTGNYNCVYKNGECVIGAPCIHACVGRVQKSNCNTVPGPQINCANSYEIVSGKRQDCRYDPISTTCSTITARDVCHPFFIASCGNGYRWPSCVELSQSDCIGYRSLDPNINAQSVIRYTFCDWNYKGNFCYDKEPSSYYC